MGRIGKQCANVPKLGLLKYRVARKLGNLKACRTTIHLSTYFELCIFHHTSFFRILRT
jgi:hypothetical protein